MNLKKIFQTDEQCRIWKTMENVKNRATIHATTSDENAIKWFSKNDI